MNENGGFVIKTESEGENHCGSFCTKEFVQEHLLTDKWELLYYCDHGATAVTDQDLYIVKKLG